MNFSKATRFVFIFSLLASGCALEENNFENDRGGATKTAYRYPADVSLDGNKYKEMLDTCINSDHFRELASHLEDLNSDSTESFGFISYYPAREDLVGSYVYVASCKAGYCEAELHWTDEGVESRTKPFSLSTLDAIFEREFNNPDYEEKYTTHNRCYIFVRSDRENRAIVYTDETSGAGESFEAMNLLFSGDWE